MDDGGLASFASCLGCVGAHIALSRAGRAVEVPWGPLPSAAHLHGDEAIEEPYVNAHYKNVRMKASMSTKALR